MSNQTSFSSVAKAPAWERVFVILVMITCCRGFDSLFALGNSGGQNALNDSSPARFTWLAILYGTAVLLLLVHHVRDLPKLLVQNKLLLVVVAYIVASTFWSVDPPTALRRSMAFALTTTFCLYLVLRFPPTDILRLAAWALFCVAIASVIAALFVPELGREMYGRKLGWWKGVCSINTSFGRFMALGMLVVWCLRRANWGLQRYDVLVLGLFALCTFQAQAATSFAAVFGAFVSIVVVWSRTPFDAPLPAKLAVGALFAAVLVLTLPFYSSEVFDILQRDDTLTNRIFIWSAAYEQGWLNPVFGVGYESFWIESNAAGAFFNMFGSGNTIIGNGHNGYLDAWLELGFVGLACLAALLIQAFIRVTRYGLKHDDPMAQFYGGLLVFILIYSIAEKAIFVHSEITWLLFTTGLVATKWRLAGPEAAASRMQAPPDVIDGSIRRGSL
ncbi:O-antigen ligase family protein [Emcibacter sp. SYSU 3D8]|uniref:O-antigen ligase family protein n=1 Tax=Emcibacter sp. SYSU 3D8 TaxID=3133969 RepID=UPI0031FE5FA5